MKRPIPNATCSDTGMPITEDHLKLCMSCRSAKHYLRDCIILVVTFVVIFILCIFLGGI